MDKIKGSTETTVYITDDAYHILNYNKALKREIPELQKGDICYEVLCGESEPCRDCPLNRDNKAGTMIYNKKLQHWVEVNTGIIEWPETGTANILISRYVQEGNKNLFYNLTSITQYDELYELNLTKGSYKILSHVDGKYIIPEKEGRLEAMIAEVSDEMVHPDDREAFLDFWSLDKLMPRLLGRTDGQGINEQFRKKLVSGGYCWVDQRAVPLTQGNSDDQIIMCFIQDIDKRKKREDRLKQEKESRDAHLDLGVGLYRRSIFLGKAEEFLQDVNAGSYCLMAIDIEHFKLFNEWYGRDAGDEFLANIGTHLKKAQNEHHGIAGYMGDDDFCIILPNDKAVIMRLQNEIMGYVKRYAGNAGFLPAFGVYEIENPSLAVSMMYDRASVALASVKGNFAQRVSWYDSGMMRKMEENHKLLTEVQRALEEEQFTFYAQPKCDMKTGKIVGLESLVRWNHPVRGIVSPGEFIPLLESNGFIAKLDLYIWEKVCRCMREWIDKGHTAIPISVNVSRIDIYTLDVVACFRSLIKKYDLEPRLLEVEITESAYAEEYKAISEVVAKLQGAGFTVLMDDFGSGYSSLNMLKDVNVDILKMDMKFLEADEHNVSKGMEILEAIIRMARLMNMRVIAEGVETKSQVDMLLDMGCIYGQGYYFYRPMPLTAFEELLDDEDNIEFAGIELWTDEQTQFGKNRLAASQKILKKKDAMLPMKEKEQELELVREKLESILRQAAINCWDWDIESRVMTISNVVRNEMLAELHPVMNEAQTRVENMPDVFLDTVRVPDKYRDRIADYIKNILNAKNHESCQCEFPIIGRDGESMWIHTACEAICDNEGRPVRAVGYYTDITKQKQQYLRSKEDIKVLQKDALTGLLNRQAAIPQIKSYLKEDVGSEAAMIMFDMDNFKVANDVFGHAYGDAIITKSAEKLKKFFRGDDIICRIGGDEFLILCKNIREEDVERRLSEVIREMEILCEKEGRKLAFTISAGYAMIPEQGQEFDELYRKADIALFTSKMDGKGIFHKYNSGMKEIRYELADEK